MKNPTLQSAASTLKAELDMQLEAYNLSLDNEEQNDTRKKIAQRIVDLEKNLVSLAAVPHR